MKFNVKCNMLWNVRSNRTKQEMNEKTLKKVVNFMNNVSKKSIIIDYIWLLWIILT